MENPPPLAFKPTFPEHNPRPPHDTSQLSESPKRDTPKRFDVSKDRSSSVTLVDYKSNTSPFNKRILDNTTKSNESPKKSKFATQIRSMTAERAAATPKQADRPPIDSAGSIVDMKFRHKLKKVWSFAKWQRLIVKTSSTNKHVAAVALRNKIRKELEGRLRNQPRAKYDFGEKITCMCLTNDGRYMVVATHYNENWKRINKPDLLKEDKSKDEFSHRAEEGQILDPLLKFDLSENLDLDSRDQSEALKTINLTQTRSPEKVLHKQKSMKHSPVLWLFDLAERNMEKLPIEGKPLEVGKEITSMAITKDGKTLFFTCDLTVQQYDLTTRKRVEVYDNIIEKDAKDRKGGVSYVSLIQNDTCFVAVAFKDAVVSVYNIKKRSRKFTNQGIFKDYIASVAIPPDGELTVMSFFSGMIIALNNETEKIINTFNIYGEQGLDRSGKMHIKSISLTSDKKYVVVGCLDKSIKVFDLNKGSLEWTYENTHEQHITAMTIAHGDKYLITGAFDGTFRIFDFQKRERIHPDNRHDYGLRHQGSVTSILLTHDMKNLVTSSADGILQITELTKKELVGTIKKAHQGGVSALAVSRDNRLIASGYYQGSVSVHSIDTTVLHVKDDIHSKAVKAVKFTSDNNFLITGSDDCSIKIISMATWTVSHTFTAAHKRSVTALAITTNDRYLVSGSSDSSIKLFSLRNHDLLHSYEDVHRGAILCLAVSLDNRYIVSGGEDRCICIHSTYYKMLGRLHIFTDAHKGPINCLTITRDNKFVISGSTDRSIRVFNIEKRERIYTIEDAHEDSINGVAISRDGRYIVSASIDKSIRMFDAEKRKNIYTFVNAHAESINTLALTSDHLHIISGSVDNTINIFSNPFSPKSLVVTESDRISPFSYFGLFVLNYFIEESDPELKNRILIKYKDLNLYPHNLNLFHITAVFFPHQDLIKFCLESGIPFSGEAQGRTPLHYLLNSDKIDFNNINYILENFDNLMANSKESYKILAEVTQDLPNILKLSPSLVVNLLKYAVGHPLSYCNEEITTFGSIKGGSQRRSVQYKSPIFTPEVKSMLLDEEESNHLLSIRLVLLFMDYSLHSVELLRLLNALEAVDSEEIFQTKAISVLIDHLWHASKRQLYVLVGLFSTFMVLLSIYASFREDHKSLAMEVVLLIFGFGFLFYEGVQLLAVGAKMYFTDFWNFIDISGDIMLITLILSTWGGAKLITKQWLMTISLFLGYAKWISFFRIIDQTRKLIRIIIEILKDMRSFIAILIFIIIGFSLIFFQFDADQGIAYQDRLLLVYNLLYAQFDISNYNSSQIFYLVVVTVLLNVVLLNLLIAIMTGTYERVHESSMLTDSKEKIRLTLETVAVRRMLKSIKDLFQKKDLGSLKQLPEVEDPDAHKGYLFFVEAVGTEAEDKLEGEGDGGEEIMRDIVKEEMQNRYKGVQRKVADLEGLISRQDHKMATLKRSLAERMDVLEKNIATMFSITQESK